MQGFCCLERKCSSQKLLFWKLSSQLLSLNIESDWQLRTLTWNIELLPPFSHPSHSECHFSVLSEHAKHEHTSSLNAVTKFRKCHINDFNSRRCFSWMRQANDLECSHIVWPALLHSHSPWKTFFRVPASLSAWDADQTYLNRHRLNRQASHLDWSFLELPSRTSL